MNTIFEKVFVETPVDTDGDGKYDLIAVYIKRPKETLEGKKVPAIYVANPYMLSCNEDWYIPHNVDQEIKAYKAQNISREEITYDFDKELSFDIKEERQTAGYAETSPVAEDVEMECISELYDYFNEHGYASVFCGGLGTKDSEGFTLTGSREEVMAFKAVIDWLNGRCRAFTNKTDNIEIKATWCTGKVAMSAKSYLGTLCIGVATTGVEGLETIIPEAAISNWYAYYRYGGLNLPAMGWQGDDLDILAKYCFSRAKDPEDYAKVKDAYNEALQKLVDGEDRDTGNYNLFWDERNYLNQIDKLKCSVLLIHGINDWNVKTNQCVPFFKLLEERGIERKMMLHQGEHVYIYRLKASNTMDILHRWLDHYLYGVDNGIEKEAKVLVESNIDQENWMASENWPPKESAYVKFPINARENHGVIVDDLSKTVFEKEKDNLKEWLDELVLSDDPAYTNRLKYVWNPFEDEKKDCNLRMSGTVKVGFDAAIDRETAVLSAMLVDLGEDCRITAEEVSVEPAEGDPAKVLAAEDRPVFRFGRETEPSQYKVISRGWLNAQNRTCLWSKEEIEKGKMYHYDIEMVPTDYTVKNGHKLALILYGIDAEETQRPETVTTISVDNESLLAQVPLLEA